MAAHVRGGEIIAEFTEVESGRKADRPQLAAAIAYAKKRKAVLVIAKLDRLARNVAFIANVMDGGVEFAAYDFPQANRLILHILAAVAEHEAMMISTRTKEALAAAKARGVKIGGGSTTTWCGPPTRSRPTRGRPTCGRSSRRSGRPASPRWSALPGRSTRGIKTARGGAWSATQVSRVM
ncbi:DNA invertase Pin-like site-specific DNA recombinase [Methylobacterium sp. BE186]|nr:DNA invertase Pin-like site-specific DNA recombinase [Methylobacterium sp. BE186]